MGRYYMQHPKGRHGIAVLNRESPLSSLYTRGLLGNGARAVARVTFSDEFQRREQMPNPCVGLCPLFDLSDSPVSLTLRALHQAGTGVESGSRLRHEFSKLGPFVRSLLRNVLANRRLSGVLSVVNHLEQIPNAESRVVLSDQKDELGVSQLQVHWRIAQCERESLIALHKLLKEKFALHGLGSFESDLDPPSGVWPVSTDAAHHIGTTRMHRDPKRGVIDANCRVHGIQNLFISGSSVFPTSGYANPTLTIVALAVRLAAHLKAIYAEHHPVKAVSSMSPPLGGIRRA